MDTFDRLDARATASLHRFFAQRDDGSAVDFVSSDLLEGRVDVFSRNRLRALVRQEVKRLRDADVVAAQARLLQGKVNHHLVSFTVDR